MKAFLLDTPGALSYVADIAAPAGTQGREIVTVRAAALTNLDIAVAEGRHYFSSPIWPRGIGREAVAITAAGKRVFVNAIAVEAPYGTHAEQVLVDPSAILPIPEGLSDELAAAIGNAGLAAWLSLSWRARLSAGESVLVLGATGASGRIAVAAARQLGAGKVVAVGRNRAVLDRLLEQGADAVVPLNPGQDLTAAFLAAAPDGFDIVIDFLNGAPAEAALGTMRKQGRMVQIGSTLAQGTMVNAQAARRGSLDVLGFAYYHAPIERQTAAFAWLSEAALAGAIGIDYRSIPLDRAADAWTAQKAGAGIRWVITP